MHISQEQILKGIYYMFCLHVYVCVCTCVCAHELVCLHIPGPLEPWIISFTLTCTEDELEESASFDFLAFDTAASQHQRLDETRAAALRGSSLTLSLSPSLPLPSVLLCLVLSGPLSAVFHSLLWPGKSVSYDFEKGGPLQRLTPKVEHHA